MDLHKFPNKCQCENPGFCPIFNKKMGVYPPDWNWCQKASKSDRFSYYELLCKAPKTNSQQLLELFQEFHESGIEKKFHILHYLSLSNKYHHCEEAQINQRYKNLKMQEYITKQKHKNSDIEHLEVLCLGHSEKQFNSIKDRSYIKKVNLNTINAGDYCDNKWAEARAFISRDDLFLPSTKFVGFTTASWNIKYVPFSKIDYLHKWHTLPVLLNSEPSDRVILCADIFCPCLWFPNELTSDSVLKIFFDDNDYIIADKFRQTFNISIIDHFKVPFSNQMICHREIFDEYRKYLIDFEVFEKIRWLVEDFGHKYLIKRSNKTDQVYINGRINAYLMECVFCFWHYNNYNKSFYLPNAERKETWYTNKEVKNRVRYFNS